ncbi:hypothetical protein GDO81_029284 [Engystomops pustulosus]|uniref:G-protein coupled receptors family 1 profile domain-containing protein n=1 Tax=Engystomops pustulosus TaxID=76066 RepID=A0AAV6ZI51_ENGPU|nr:hypothetical protein GDO81_029284 [Engystomops pustulosus]
MILDLSFTRFNLAGWMVNPNVLHLFHVNGLQHLLMMALDRYIAICKPLRYSNIITRNNLVLLFIAALARSVLFISPVIYLASRVQFCKSNVIPHFACEHMALMSLSCGNISKNKLVGLTLRVLSLLFDISFLSISYTCIMRAAFTISGATRQKTLHTCGTHILVILIIIFFRLSSSIVYRASRSASQDTHNLLTAIYLLIPALINPLIYGLRTTEIRHRILKLFGFCDDIRTALPPKLE